MCPVYKLYVSTIALVIHFHIQNNNAKKLKCQENIVSLL